MYPFFFNNKKQTVDINDFRVFQIEYVWVGNEFNWRQQMAVRHETRVFVIMYRNQLFNEQRDVL
jgi:hypothetical protein